MARGWGLGQLPINFRSPVSRACASVGVNRVLPHTCSLAHAETMAYMLAQQRTQRARLNEDAIGERLGPITLATSSQP